MSATARFVARAYFSKAACQSAGSNRPARREGGSAAPVGSAEGGTLSTFSLRWGEGMAYPAVRLGRALDATFSRNRDFRVPAHDLARSRRLRDGHALRAALQNGA